MTDRDRDRQYGRVTAIYALLVSVVCVASSLVGALVVEKATLGNRQNGNNTRQLVCELVVKAGLPTRGTCP